MSYYSILRATLIVNALVVSLSVYIENHGLAAFSFCMFIFGIALFIKST